MQLYFERSRDTTVEFHEIIWDGKVLTTKTGLINAAGKIETQNFPSKKQAEAAVDKLLKEIVSLGYLETPRDFLAALKNRKPVETVYLENDECFFEIAQVRYDTRIRWGVVGKPSLALYMSYGDVGSAVEEYKDIIAEQKSKGFKNTKPTMAIVEGPVAHILYTDNVSEHSIYREVVSDSEFEMARMSEYRNDSDFIIHFRDGFDWEENFSFSEIDELGLGEVAVLIEGDMKVSGVLSDDMETNVLIVVTGDMVAGSFVHGDLNMRILGNLAAANTVCGDYSDLNDCCLQVRGDVYAHAWITSDLYDHMPVSGMICARIVWECHSSHSPDESDSLDGLLQNLLFMKKISRQSIIIY